MHRPAMYRLFVLSISTCLLALAACTAPMQGDGDAARARLAAPDAPAEASTPPAGRQAPPMSDPLPPQTRPPQRVPDDAAAPQTAPAGEVTLDRSCRRDADCTIKNVGNCCGEYPACVNVDSPTDPAGVQARCAAQGMVSTCGFPAISSCQCVQGECEGSSAAVVQ